MPQHQKPDPPHFNDHTALVLLFSLLCAIGAGFLIHAETHSLPMAVLTGGAAFVAAWSFWDRVIG